MAGSFLYTYIYAIQTTLKMPKYSEGFKLPLINMVHTKFYNYFIFNFLLSHHWFTIFHLSNDVDDYWMCFEKALKKGHA